MATHRLRGTIADQFVIATAGESWQLVRSGVIKTDDFSAILISESAVATRLTIDGSIDNTNSYGIVAKGAGHSIVVSSTGSIKGSTSQDAVNLKNSKIENDGEITGHIVLEGSCRFQNSGTVETYSVDSDALHLINARDGRIVTQNGLGASKSLSFENHGTFRSTPTHIILSGDGEDRIRNDGKIVADIYLGSGNDEVDLRGGVFKGIYYGALGDDLLITDNAKYTLTEAEGEGFDTVASYVTYTLNANVETLILKGRRDLNGLGIVGTQFLHGNDGDNILKGRGGADLLDGGGGDDRLFGGLGEDQFYFQRGYGHDVVKDFKKGDVIELGDWPVGDGFDEVLDHARNGKHGAVIFWGHGTLTIEDIAVKDLTADDFSFGN